MSFGISDTCRLTQQLIRCPSVTPREAGALDLVQSWLEELGASCRRLPFGKKEGRAEIDNLYAEIGTGSPRLLFCGHVDVVPTGPISFWSQDPFGAAVVDGRLYGRGAVDMKSAVAAFVAAVSEFLEENPDLEGSIAFIITCDEEDVAKDGTVRVLEWMSENGKGFDFCLVGEPTGEKSVADAIKVGRRGSIRSVLRVEGEQGHTAYPQNAANPVHPLVEMLHRLSKTPLDSGTPLFLPSKLQVTSVDVGNPASNIIPACASASFDIRFNPNYTEKSVVAWIRSQLDPVKWPYTLNWKCAHPFFCPPGKEVRMLQEAVLHCRGYPSCTSTNGGTSDARFVKDYGPVAEMGLVVRLAHHVDESVPLSELLELSTLYKEVLRRYFGTEREKVVSSV